MISLITLYRFHRLKLHRKLVRMYQRRLQRWSRIEKQVASQFDLAGKRRF